MQIGIADLPRGVTEPKALEFAHFPTRWQAVLWRNWGLVSLERLARVLRASPQQMPEAAEELGLPVPPRVNSRWLSHGYITLIRNNWHLLPYEQLLELLDWTPEHLAYILKEDDFLWIKLGLHKPQCQPVHYEPLTPPQRQRTQWIAATMRRYVQATAPEQEPFAFLEQFDRHVNADASLPGTNEATAPGVASEFDLAFGYSYVAPCGDPLVGSTDQLYPEAMLRDFARQGVNGIWLHGILYTLFPWPHAPELSQGHEARLANLRRLTELAARHGLGVYLYLNEPRGLSTSFFERHPEFPFKGAESVGRFEHALCTSHSEVLDFVSDGCEFLFRQVPLLAGVFCITMSENTTHCHSKPGFAKVPCPRCTARSTPEVIAEVVSAIERGIHRAKPAARVMVWNWAWDLGWEHELIDLLPEGVEVLCTSEEYLPFVCGGVENHVRDYSISRVGPSDRALEVWRHAQQRGLKAVAKVQLNTTWECSAVPYLPTPTLVKEHLDNLKREDIRSLMISWTVGGYSGGNLALLTKSCHELAVERFGSKAADAVVAAWEAFGEAFKEFPFRHGMLYRAPQNFGPMNLLYLEPTGYKATMIGFCYDDLTLWRQNYPEDVFADQFRKLSEGWRRGLVMLDKAQARVAPDHQPAMQELMRIAEAVYCHFRSSYLQIEFVRRRNGTADAAPPPLTALCREEAQLAHRLYELVRQDARIGFEASNHYYYTTNDLLEKILNCEFILTAIQDSVAVSADGFVAGE